MAICKAFLARKSVRTAEDAGKGSVGVDAESSCVTISHRDDTNKHVLHDHNESRSLTMVYPLNFNKLLHHVNSYVVPYLPRLSTMPHKCFVSSSAIVHKPIMNRQTWLRQHF
jgi:hypothetical protein